MKLDLIGSAYLRRPSAGETALPDTLVLRRGRFTTGSSQRWRAEPVKSSFMTI